MTDRLRLVSHFPGRLRVRAATFRILPDVGEDVAQRLREEAGVSSATLAPTTGSIVIEYDPAAVQLTRIVLLLIRVGGLHGLEVDALPETPAVGPSPGDRVRGVVDVWNRYALRAADGKADIRTALPALLAVAGIGMFLTGRRPMPTWYDLFNFSFMTFCNMNPHKPKEAPAVRTSAP